MNFEGQKMKTRLCAQVFSNSAAIAIDVCRILGIEGFEDSQGTVKFLMLFDKYSLSVQTFLQLKCVIIIYYFL